MICAYNRYTQLTLYTTEKIECQAQFFKFSFFFGRTLKFSVFLFHSLVFSRCIFSKIRKEQTQLCKK